MRLNTPLLLALFHPNLVNDWVWSPRVVCNAMFSFQNHKRIDAGIRPFRAKCRFLAHVAVSLYSTSVPVSRTLIKWSGFEEDRIVEDSAWLFLHFLFWTFKGGNSVGHRESCLGPPVVPFYPFPGEGSPTEIDYRKKGALIAALAPRSFSLGPLLGASTKPGTHSRQPLSCLCVAPWLRLLVCLVVVRSVSFCVAGLRHALS